MEYCLFVRVRMSLSENTAGATEQGAGREAQPAGSVGADQGADRRQQRRHCHGRHRGECISVVLQFCHPSVSSLASCSGTMILMFVAWIKVVRHQL